MKSFFGQILTCLVAAALVFGCGRNPGADRRNTETPPARLSEIRGTPRHLDVRLVGPLNRPRPTRNKPVQEPPSSPVVPAVARVAPVTPGPPAAIPAPPSEASPEIRSEPARPPRQVSSILVVGDSLSVGIGLALAQETRQDPRLSVRAKGKTATGLICTGYYNWIKKLDGFIEQYQPDLVVTSIGGNDALIGAVSPQWNEKWADRLERFLRVAADRGIPVLLVDLPPMKNRDFQRKAAETNRIMKEVCGKLPECRFLELGPLASGPDGNFIARKEMDGRMVSLRTADGCHFTFAGYQAVSREILDVIAGTWGAATASPTDTGKVEPVSTAGSVTPLNTYRY